MPAEMSWFIGHSPSAHTVSTPNGHDESHHRGCQAEAFLRKCPRPVLCSGSSSRKAISESGQNGHRHSNSNGASGRLIDDAEQEAIADHASHAADLARRITAALAPPSSEAELFSLIDPDDQEQSRSYRRTAFDFQRWREHRDTSRYARHIGGIVSSRVVRALAKPLGLVALLSVAVGCYESLLEAGELPSGLHSVSITNSDPFNLSSFALSLLLVFRTNTSYSRWEEARNVWGSVVNRSRDLLRQVNCWVAPDQEQLRVCVQRWVLAYSRSLQVHLREDGDIDYELQGILLPEELHGLRAATHRPNYTIAALSRVISKADVPDTARVRMDETLSAFVDAVGMCERIMKTPIPLTYTRHTSRFMVIWLAFLPFTLWPACGWAVVPASVTIAFLLLGIDEIGVQIEEPFGILPLEHLCALIARDCMEMAAQEEEICQLLLVYDDHSGT